MWVFNKSFENIEESDIKELLDRGITENQNLEYKLEFGQSDDDKKKMSRHISSMANAYGGYLIVGIRENRETGAPLEIVGVENAENERDRIMSSCLSNIEPRIPGLKIKTVPIQDRNPVILILIPRSTRAPHAVRFGGGRSEFWRRHDRQKNPMSIEEIREAFLRTENIRKDIEEFIKERKQEILEEIGGNPTYVIGAAPITVKNDIVDIGDKNIHEMLRHPPNQRYGGCNLDFGINILPEPTLYGLQIEEHFMKVEFSRNGYLELRIKIIDYFLTSETIRDGKGKEYNVLVLNALPLVEYAVSFYRLLKALVEYLGLTEPYVGFLGLYNINGLGLRRLAGDRLHLGVFNKYYGPNFWNKTHLEIPPMQILSLENPDKIAKSFVDRVWNAFGYEMAPLFRSDGQFELFPFREGTN